MAVEQLHDRLQTLNRQFHVAAGRYDEVSATPTEATASAQPSPVYTCDSGTVPVFAKVSHFAPYISPEYWQDFASSMQIKVIDRVSVTPEGWSGVVDEMVKPLSGDGALARMLTLHNRLGTEFVNNTGSGAGEPQAQVTFQLRKSLDGVLDRNQGYMRAVEWRELGMNWTHIKAQKSLQLQHAPPDWFEHLIPGMLKAILNFWLWEYSLRFMLDPPRGVPSQHSLAGDAGHAWIKSAFHEFEAEFEKVLKGIEHAVETHSSGAG